MKEITFNLVLYLRNLSNTTIHKVYVSKVYISSNKQKDTKLTLLYKNMLFRVGPKGPHSVGIF